MRSSKLGAWILIGLGILFLLGNLGVIPRLGPLLAQWWPVILILIGVYLLVRKA
jgi:lipopolysaccharide export LptBFGC system permease protein LptF